MDKEETIIEKNCIYCGGRFKELKYENDEPQIDGEYSGICPGCQPVPVSQGIMIYCPDCGIKLPNKPIICPTCYHGTIRSNIKLKIKHFKIKKGDWLIVNLPKGCRRNEREGILFNIQRITEQTGARAIILPVGAKLILTKWGRYIRNALRRLRVIKERH